jgi:glutamyl-tRNA(Gln) amidotransferase subunit D
VKAAEEIANDISEGADGVVIAHGTDTMHYTSAALSFMVKTCSYCHYRSTEKF